MTNLTTDQKLEIVKSILKNLDKLDLSDIQKKEILKIALISL